MRCTIPRLAALAPSRNRTIRAFSDPRAATLFVSRLGDRFISARPAYGRIIVTYYGPTVRHMDRTRAFGPGRIVSGVEYDATH